MVQLLVGMPSPRCNRTVSNHFLGPYDYTGSEKILVFNKSTHSINVDVPLVNDGLAEDNESFLAQLLAVSPSGRVTIAPATTLITIIDTNSEMMSSTQPHNIHNQNHCIHSCIALQVSFLVLKSKAIKFQSTRIRDAYQ